MDVEKKEIYGTGHQIGGRNAGRFMRSQNTSPFPLCPSDSPATLGKDHIRWRPLFLCSASAF